MKLFVTLAFYLLSLQYSLCQSASDTISICEKLIRIDADSARGTYNLSSREDIIVSKDGKDAIKFVFLEIDKVIIIHIDAVGGGDCVDETNKIAITFRDGSKLNMPNNGRFNCDGEFSLFFNGGYGNKKELNMFRTKEIEYVKVETRKSLIDKTRKNFVEAYVPTEKSKSIMQILDCLVY